MPDFGIGEAIAGLLAAGGGTLPVDAGAAALGAGALGAGGAAAGGADLAGVLGTIGAQNVAEAGILGAAAPELDAAAAAAGLGAADIGGSFASLAGGVGGLGSAGGMSAALGGAPTTGSLSTALPGAATGAGATPIAAAPSAGAGGGGVGGAIAGAAPAGVPTSGLAGGDVTTALTADLPVAGGQTAAASGVPQGLTGLGGVGAGPSSAIGRSAALLAAPSSGLDTATVAGAASPAVGAPANLGASAPAAAGGAGGSGFDVGSLFGGAGSKLAANPLGSAGALISGGSLLANVLQGDKKPQGYGDILNQARTDASQGAQLQSYLTSGTLPPGIAAGLQQAHAAAEATIKSQYANRGESGSSAETQDLQNLANTTVAQGADIATKLLQQGVQESEFSSQLYEELMKTNINQDTELSKSIANFAGSLANFGGRSGGQTYQLQPVT